MTKLGIRTPRLVGLVVGLLAAAAAVTVASCGQTPTNVPIRTFEGAQKVAVVCLKVSDPSNGFAVPVTAVPQTLCTPVASGLVGAGLNYHLAAMVTQTTRGELAVVDLTAGEVVDEDKATPGINFIPVGTNPTDVVVPVNDPTFAYVSSASPIKPAIFVVPSNRLLGEAPNIGVLDTEPPLLLTDLAACSLPQPPVALAVLTVQSATPAADGGTIDGGASTDGGSTSDGGTTGGGGTPTTPGPYQLIALLGPQGGAGARVVTIDHSALDTTPPGTLPPCNIVGSRELSDDLPATASAGPAWPDGVPYLDGGVGDLSAQEPAAVPIAVCPNDGGAAVDGGTLASDAGDGGTTTSAPAPLAEAGPSGEVDAAVDAGNGAAPSDGAVDDDASEVDGAAEDSGVVATPDASEADASSPIVTASDGGIPVTVEPLSVPRPVSMVIRDDAPIVYVGDSSLPMIHVIDLTVPTAPIERAPLVATSVTQPTRQVQVGALALSPPTHDYKRYLYAIDTAAGSLMVYDVSDATGETSPHVPLVRPHAELNPFIPPDRVSFAAPVATVAFVQHDWPLVLPSSTNANQSLAYSGLICNPNPNAHPSASDFVDLGAYYRVDQVGVIQANATAQYIPSRLRGIFAFATLTNGSVVAIDVDDWDAPCRRPDPMEVGAGNITGSLDVPQPAAGPGDLDPYHVPLAYQGGGGLAESPAVTLEQFFPVSAPHRIRSSVLLRNDTTSGNHLPQVVQTPELSDVNGTPVATVGKAGIAEPLILPPALEEGFIDPTTVQNPSEPNPAERTFLPGQMDAGTVPDPPSSPSPGVRLAFDDPTVQQSQDWAVTYEGALPSTAGGIVATIESTVQPDTTSGAYSTLTFATQGADLCGLGVEDWAIGQARANAALCAMDPTLVSSSEKTLPQWTDDYVEITDDILAQGDPYWGISGNACWPSDAAPGIADGDPNVSNERYDICQATFGAPGSDPDLDINRDAPILSAYKDHFVVGRFAHLSSQIETTQNRTVDPGGPNNPPFLKLLACCFHKQAAFKVRTGGEWVAVGQQSLGLLHHVVAAPSTDPDPGRCVLSTDPQAKLLNARSFDVPWATPTACTPTAARPAIDRNSVLAMRNPLFSYVTWGGCGPVPSGTGDHTLSARDLAWKFSVAGGFSPLTISIAGTSGASVSPQSMLFLNSVGQLAVIDGADQGLVLIDLNSVSFGTNYF